jgi:hypothetical protein
MLPTDILGAHQIIKQLPNAWLRAHKINTHVHHEQSRDSQASEAGWLLTKLPMICGCALWGTSNQTPFN